MQIYIAWWYCIHNHCWPPDQEICRCSLSDSGKNWDFKWVYNMLFFKMCQQAVKRPREEIRMVSLCLSSMRVPPTSRYIANQKPVPQVEVPRQINGPFSQAAWWCISVCCLCNVLGVIACSALSLIIQSCGAQEHKPFWPPGLGD